MLDDITKGAWSLWTECSATCEGTTQRKRICDFDSNFPCTNDVEVKNCSNPCPGNFHFLLKALQYVKYDETVALFAGDIFYEKIH